MSALLPFLIAKHLPLLNTPDKEEDRYHYETTSGEKRICPGVVSVLGL